MNTQVRIELFYRSVIKLSKLPPNNIKFINVDFTVVILYISLNWRHL